MTGYVLVCASAVMLAAASKAVAGTMGSVIMFSVPNDSVITVLVEESRPSSRMPREPLRP